MSSHEVSGNHFLRNSRTPGSPRPQLLQTPSFLHPRTLLTSCRQQNYFNPADAHKGWKGEPLFLEGEAEETGDMWWEDEQ